MFNPESYIARYLDGEMSPSELERFGHRLSGSAELQLLLQEMIALRRAARKLPVLHAPPTHLESMLFQRLRHEGLYADRPAGTTSAEGDPGKSRRRLALVAPLLLLLLLGGGYLAVNDSGSDLVRRDVREISLFTTGDQLAGMVAQGVHPVVAKRRRWSEMNGSEAESQIGNHGANLRHDRAAIMLPTGGNVDIPTEAVVLPSLGSLAPEVVRSEPYQAGSLPALVASYSAPLIDRSFETRRRTSAMVASLNGGMSEISSGDGIPMRDMQMRIGLEFDAGDRLSLIVGSSPAVTEFRHENVGPIAAPPGGGAVKKQFLAQPPSAHRIEVREGAWLGLGYQRPVVDLAGVRLNAGVNVGSSASAFRFGGDISVSRKVSKGISVEVSGTASQMIPYDRHVEQFVVFDSPDRFVYSGASQNPSFYSYGVQAGVTINLAQ